MKVSMFHLMPYSAMPEEPPHGPDWKSAGIWVDLPNSVYNPEIGNELYNEYLDELEYAEQVGLDGVCVNEHHANMYGTMPSPSIMLASLARRTSKANLIVLGTSIALYNPPTRVAEEMSMIDVISGGRVVCGFPVGTSQDTNWVYGMSPSTFRERYYEAEDLIKKAMETREPFHYNGKYTKLRYVSIWPRPAQEPRPPIWVPGGGSIETWDWTIEKDHVYAALSYGGYKRAQQTLNGYWSRVREHGADETPYRAAYMQLTLVSDSYEQAKAEYQEGVEFFYQKLLGSTGRYFPEAPGYRTEASIRAGFERSLALAQESAPQAGRKAPQGAGPSWDQLVEEGNIVAGSPDEVAEKLRDIAKSLRVGHVLPLLQIGNMRRETTMKNIKMFGEEVLPQIHDVWDDEDWEDRWSPRPLAQRVSPAPVGG